MDTASQDGRRYTDTSPRKTGRRRSRAAYNSAEELERELLKSWAGRAEEAQR